MVDAGGEFCLAATRPRRISTSAPQAESNQDLLPSSSQRQDLHVSSTSNHKSWYILIGTNSKEEGQNKTKVWKDHITLRTKRRRKKCHRH
ncbi:hypothetical protein L208DRAFT_1395836 [Tricholoma matsutake]|nr:hypothetical protein L208DRAFT_1395836 [Tricholoma matsutake 945]